MENILMNVLDFSHACEIFDNTKKISDDDINFILKAGKKSTSSFGMKPWKFLVISNEELKTKISPLCSEEIPISSSSHLVIFLAAIESINSECESSNSKSVKKGFPADKLEFYTGVFPNHPEDSCHSNENMYSWPARQTYLSAGNMMTAAAIKGIDSCPIESYEKENIEEVLGLDTSKFQIACLLPFGYRLNEQSSTDKESLDDSIEFIK